MTFQICACLLHASACVTKPCVFTYKSRSRAGLLNRRVPFWPGARFIFCNRSNENRSFLVIKDNFATSNRNKFHAALKLYFASPCQADLLLKDYFATSYLTNFFRFAPMVWHFPKQACHQAAYSKGVPPRRFFDDNYTLSKHSWSKWRQLHTLAPPIQ